MIDDGADKPGHSLRTLVAQALRAYKTPELLQFLRSKDVVVRSAAARELQIRGGKAVLHQTVLLLADEMPQSREVASFILGQLGTPKRPFRIPSIAALLAQVAKETDTDVLEAALVSLGHLRATDVIAELHRFSKHKAPNVRAAFAYYLGLSNAQNPKVSNEVTTLLETLRRDRHRTVRSAAKFSQDVMKGTPL